MKWEKLGLICKPNGRWWSKTHCYTPTPYFLHDRIRVYYSSWDEGGRGRIGYADFSADDPTILKYQTREPVLDIGEPGTFDCDGVCPEQILYKDNKEYLYYIGFQRTAHKKIDFIFCGVAIGDGYEFKKHGRVPLLDRTEEETFIRSSVSVVPVHKWYYMWYTASRTGWLKYKGARKYHSWTSYPTYDISLMVTDDPLRSSNSIFRCIGLREGDEIAVGRPWVIHEDDKFKMWYSVKSLTIPYKIAYAESRDGICWDRMPDEEVGLYVSEDDWDSEMVCFPAIVDINGERYAFYNGNEHGKDGFGLARLIK